MGKKAALWDRQGRDGREGTAHHWARGFDWSFSREVPHPGISMNFAYSLVSQHDVFPHLRDKAPQGKTWNLITMQIQLGCYSLTSPSPPSFPSLPKNYLGVQPYFSIFPLEVSQKHHWTCADGYTHLTLSVIVKNPHPELAYHLLGFCSWNYQLFHWIFLNGM